MEVSEVKRKKHWQIRLFTFFDAEIDDDGTRHHGLKILVSNTS